MRNLYHIPVTQEHLDAGQNATWQNRAGDVAVIPHEGECCPEPPWTLSALKANL